MQGNFTDAFILWIHANQARLDADKITVQLPEKRVGNGTHAEFFAHSTEATVEIWDYGFSEFHFLDWEAAERDPDMGVVVTHYEFARVEELYAALDQLVNRMSPVLAR